MDLLSSWIDAAKNLAQTAIKDRFDNNSLMSGQALLSMLMETFQSMPPERRQEFFQVLKMLLAQHQTDKKAGTEAFLQELFSHPVVREVAGHATQRLLKMLINKAK